MGLTQRQQATQQFADELAALRASRGSPSFRRMAEKSGCISHTTLHEAVSGHRFPSWDTTKQFVLACGADPGPWEQRWGAASTVAGSRGPVVNVVQEIDAGPQPTEESPPTPEVPKPPSSDAVVSRSGEGRRVSDTSRGKPAWVPVAILLVAAILIIGFVTALVDDEPLAGAEAGSSSRASPDYESAQKNTLGQPASPCNPIRAKLRPGSPLRPGDKLAMLGFTTFGQCSMVPVNTRFTTGWLLKNTGTVPWRGRSLSRVGDSDTPDACRATSSVPVPDVAPGDDAIIGVSVQTLKNSGVCYLQFSMLDADGRRSFPASGPLYVYVYVA